MTKKCDNCGKELAFLEERTYESPDGKKMLLCINCFEKMTEKPSKLICSICGKMIVKEQKFIIDGTFPKFTTMWLGLMFLDIFDFLERLPEKIFKGNMYHRDCFIKKIIDEYTK